ncbi:hypothetical protein KR018_000335, partial [Drosophila ironensis]
GDFVSEDDEDPRRRGVLRSTSCRRHRERLRSARKSIILQSLTVLAACVVVVAMLLFLAIEMSVDPSQVSEIPMPEEQPQQQPNQYKEIVQQHNQGLWSGVLGFLGLEADGEVSANSFIFSPVANASCDLETLDMRRIFRELSRKVLNQEQAIARMKQALSRKGETFRSVALLGPPGVGKSLAANELRRQFPWPANVHAYSWSTQVPDDVGKFRMVRQFVDGLSDCGVNLLIIDNLVTCDYGLVPIYNRLIQEREGDKNKANQTVLVVYIFNLETNMYWEQFELLQQLPSETTIASFRFFGRDDLLDCLNQELLSEHRTLSPEKQALVLETAWAEAHYSGCKSLRLLILQHGVPI